MTWKERFIVIVTVLLISLGIGVLRETGTDVYAQTVRPIVLSAPTQSAVGITPVALPNTGTVLGVTLKAICPGQVIYIGTSNGVTSSTGWPLADGDSIAIEVSNANQIWAMATSNGQRLAVLPYRRQ